MIQAYLVFWETERMCIELSRDTATDDKDFGNERTEAISQVN